MARYLVTARINVSCGIDESSRDEAKATVLSELEDVVRRANNEMVIGLGARFEVDDFGITVEELPF